MEIVIVHKQSEHYIKSVVIFFFIAPNIGRLAYSSPLLTVSSYSSQIPKSPVCFFCFFSFCLLCFSVMHTLKSIHSFSLTACAYRLNTILLSQRNSAKNGKKASSSQSIPKC